MYCSWLTKLSWNKTDISCWVSSTEWSIKFSRIKLFYYPDFDWFYCKEIRILNSWCCIGWDDIFSAPLLYTKDSSKWQPNTQMTLRHTYSKPTNFCARTEGKSHSSSHLHFIDNLCSIRALVDSPTWAQSQRQLSQLHKTNLDYTILPCYGTIKDVSREHP